MTGVPPQRVSPIGSPDEYVLPGRPEAAGAGLDAYRQTRFLLDGDLELFAAALNLQIGLVKDAYPSKHRSHNLAAIVALLFIAANYHPVMSRIFPARPVSVASNVDQGICGQFAKGRNIVDCTSRAGCEKACTDPTNGICAAFGHSTSHKRKHWKKKNVSKFVKKVCP